MTAVSDCTTSSIKAAVSTLLAGNLVAFPTETVYGLGANPSSESAIKKIYLAKGRPQNHPLIIHISSANLLDRWIARIPNYALKLAEIFWPGPMTLILPRSELAKNFVTGGQENVGVRVPAHKCALALLREFESQGGFGIAAPSANRFGKVSPTSAEDVKDELLDSLSEDDLILDGGSSEIGIESTIINCTQNLPIILRPGAVTSLMIEDLIGMKVEMNMPNNSGKIRTSGLFESHYAPKAKVHLSGEPKHGDGLIALAKIQTPPGIIRLASPENNEEFARILYRSLRLADTHSLINVYVVPPTGDDIAVAVWDRLLKSSTRL